MAENKEESWEIEHNLDKPYVWVTKRYINKSSNVTRTYSSPNTLENLAVQTIASLTSFHNIEKLGLPNMLSTKIKNIRKTKEVNCKDIQQIESEVLDLLGENDREGHHPCKVDYKYFKQYERKFKEKCYCHYSDLEVQIDTKVNRNMRTLCIHCAVKTYKEDKIIIFVELDKWYDHDYRFGSGKKLVCQNELTVVPCDQVSNIIYCPSSYCDDCMSPLYEINLNKIDYNDSPVYMGDDDY